MDSCKLYKKNNDAVKMAAFEC